MRVEQVERRSTEQLCSLLGYSRQAYYQGKQEDERHVLGNELIVQEVLNIRQKQPRIGGRKLLVMMDDFLNDRAIGMGRDAFFDLLRASRLLVRRRRRNKPVTTFSHHWFKKYPNLIKGFIPTGPDQLWVSDITYIKAGSEFAYLSLITDGYSRKIVGYYLCKNLSATGCLNALKMALKDNPERQNLIHHSDRGSQYCCGDYIKLLKKGNISISMTQSGDPLENAMAERVNGILKDELLEGNYASFKEAQEAIALAVSIYNYQRPHLSIDMLTPAKAHHLSGEMKKHWKNYYQKREEAPVMSI